MESEIQISHQSSVKYTVSGNAGSFSASSHSNGVPKSGSLQLQWNPNDLQIKTKSVEKILEPLVIQVTTLVSSKSSQKTKGKSKRARVLVAAVERATANFVEQGRIIAQENVEIQPEMIMAVDEIVKTGETMSTASKEFASDPCSSIKRGNMVKAARSLLTAVTRLLILADMVDVHLLLFKLQKVESDLEQLKGVNKEADLMDSIKALGLSLQDLMVEATKRQHDLKDPAMRENMAAARAVLNKHSAMLLATSKTYARHPDIPEAKANRDMVFQQVSDALNTISNVAKGNLPNKGKSTYERPGELATALDDFDDYIIMDSLTYNDAKSRPSLEKQLESIIAGSALLADSRHTRDEHRDGIVAECNAVRQALQNLLSEYMSNSGKMPTDQLDNAIEEMRKATKDLRGQLRKAVVDNISDNFIEPEAPLYLLIAAAKEGNVKKVGEYSKDFNEHANKLVEVAGLACTTSSDDEGVKMVRYACEQIQNLCPQVINAAKILAACPKSKVAQDNLNVFRDAWINQVRILTDAVDDITTIEDFLSVSEKHILDDVNRCIAALQKKEVEELDSTGGTVRGRSNRLCNVIDAEMDNYEPGPYTERVRDAVKLLGQNVLPNFANKVDGAIKNLTAHPIPKDVDENEFIDATRLVYEGVREIRRAVLLNRADDSDSGSERGDRIDASVLISDSETTEVDEELQSHGIANAREAMSKMPEPDRAKIAEQVEIFRTEKQLFDKEVSKWDDSGNDVVVLAKHMCMIMMEMTDFTRGKGSLQTTMDVINAAKKISEAGTKLDKLARQIADQCPESSTKKDLIAYLQQIALYCQQLKITSSVKADVQNVSGELVVSGLDSATSLIQAAKNLMGAVVLTVKSCYVASTKYTRLSVKGQNGEKQKPIVIWKMAGPDKKPLVKREKPEDSRSRVIRRSSTKRGVNPMKALSEFSSPMNDRI